MVCPAFLQKIQTNLGSLNLSYRKKLDGTDDGMLLYRSLWVLGPFLWSQSQGRNVPLGKSRQSEFLPPGQGATSQLESAPGLDTWNQPKRLSVREGIGFLPGILFTQFSCTKPGPALAPLVFSSRSDNGPAMDQTSLPSSFPVSRRWGTGPPAFMMQATSSMSTKSSQFCLSIADLQCYASF